MLSTQKPYLSLVVCSCTLFILFAGSGLILLFTWPSLISVIMNNTLLLKNGSHALEVWTRFPYALPIDFYFFNWTNPQEVYEPGAKMKFQEVGPFRYLETKVKSNITWNDNGTLTFRHLKHWYLNEDAVENDVREEVTTINPVALTAAYTSRSWSYLVRKGLSLSISSMTPSIHLTRSVSQMLFEGYKDPLISLARSLPFLAEGSVPNWDKFGWFYTRNGSETYEGVFNMGTGYNSKFGHLYSWNYLNHTPFYEGNCGSVNASAGEFFVPPLEDSIEFFSADLCRTLTLRFAGLATVHKLVGRKYVVDEYMLDNGTVYPENRCYCNGQCVPSGLVNVSSCRFGSPSFASLPHFYKADSYYQDNIEGVKGDQKKHEFYIILEQTTGIPLEVKARLQINLLLQPIPGIAMFEKVPRVFVPMLWFEQSVTVPENDAFMLRLFLNLPVICTSLAILLIFISFIVLLCFAYKICTAKICDVPKVSGERILYADESVPLKAPAKPVEIVKL